MTRAYAASSWTVPSHMTMLTSLPPSVHGVNAWGRRLAPERVTLAERFRDAGYDTAAFVAGPTLHAAFGFDQGFDLYHNTMAFRADDFQHDDPTRPSSAGQHRSHQLVTGPTASALVGQWLEHERDTPFFLFVHLWDPHYDYIPPPPYDTMFDPDYRGGFDFSNLLSNPSIRLDMPAREKAHLIALYDGEIAETDATVGTVLAALEARGWLDQTLVVVTADHGEEFFEHGGKGHFRTLYEEVVHVPLVFRLPGAIPAGRRVDAIFDAVHLMPTILGLVGLSPGPEARGRDLSGVLRGGAAPGDVWAFSELELVHALPAYAAHVGERAYLASTDQWSVLARPVGDTDPLRGDPPDARELQIVYYDLRADPAEKHALPPADAEAREFSERLKATVAELRAEGTRLAGPAEATAPRDAATEEQLRSLGYIE